MSLLDLIDNNLIERDPQLALAILEFEGLHHLTLCTYYCYQLIKKKRRRRKARSIWVSDYLQRRATQGHYNNLMRELADKNPVLYHNFTRMSETMFNDILERIRPRIEKQTTFWRKPLDPGLRLAITLRYLATGSSYRTLAYTFHVAPNTISLIVPEICRAIVEAFGDEYLKMPDTVDG